jgi:hypothetical protein
MKVATILAIIGTIVSISRLLAHGTGILRRFVKSRVEGGWTSEDVSSFYEAFNALTGTISECCILVFFIVYLTKIKPSEATVQSRLHRT